MLNKTKGIVLHYIKYGDTSIIAYIYTENFGRQAFIVNSVRSKKSRVRLNQFQPLSILELDVYYKPGRDMQRIKDLRNHLLLHTIHDNIIKSSIALFIAEIMYKTLREVEPNQPLFDFIYNSVQILDLQNRGIENYHLVFLLHLSKYLGISPVDEEQKSLSLILTPEEKKALNRLHEYSFKNLDKIIVDNNTRINLLEKFVEYYKLHLEGIGTIKSLPVLKEVFS
ncbi:MAG: DNA repair protein RecO [Bacteroidales bacterium]|nr:MAG: DNA repair protein RecO [Bacteroidales bacterium]